MEYGLKGDATAEATFFALEWGCLASVTFTSLWENWKQFSIYGDLIPLALGVREGNGTPFQHSCLENPMDSGAW